MVNRIRNSLYDKILILHIGQHKTGTTSIQKGLAAAASQLLSDAAVLYPQSGRPATQYSNRFGQHELAWSLTGKFGAKLDVWDCFLDECEASSAQQVLVSSEGFCWLDDDRIKVLEELTRSFTKRVILVYLRRPADYLRSSYVQRVVMNPGYRWSYRYFIEENIWRVDYEQLINRWTNTFGTGNLWMKSFEQECQGGSLVRNLLMELGCHEPELRTEPRINVSPADPNVKVARWLNVLDWQLRSFAGLRGGIQRAKRRVLRSHVLNKKPLVRLVGELNTSRNTEVINCNHRCAQYERGSRPACDNALNGGAPSSSFPRHLRNDDGC